MATKKNNQRQGQQSQGWVRSRTNSFLPPPEERRVEGRRASRAESSRQCYTSADMPSPLEVDGQFWLRVERKEGVYPGSTERSGKWLFYTRDEDIERVWRLVTIATEKGELGSSAKCATAKPNRRQARPGMKVICVYTYDSNDVEDVKRVIKRLRELGIIWEASYKEDRLTREGIYADQGRVSKYLVREGSVELL
jgi:hypothetical protein